MKIFRGNLDEATLLVEIDVTLTIVLVFFVVVALNVDHISNLL